MIKCILKRKGDSEGRTYFIEKELPVFSVPKVVSLKINLMYVFFSYMTKCKKKIIKKMSY